MKKTSCILLLLAFIAIDAFSQGRIRLSNVVQPTRLYTVDGPLAGPGIWGQFFLGDTPNALTPFLIPDEHGILGFANLGEVEVPNRLPDAGVFVQLWAWDGNTWGTDVQDVPMNQFGMTDIILYRLADITGFISYPEFTRPAVVPPVPEPSVWVLVLAGVGLAVYGACRRFKEKTCSAGNWKTTAFILGFLVFTTNDAFSQGEIRLSNIARPTRLYTLDGSVAGPGIWGQFLLGDSSDNLSPFWISGQHGNFGWVSFGDVEVPNRPAYTGVFVQLWAWDGTVWGTDFQTVPNNQFGKTDIIRYTLALSTGFIEPPPFTQPAVVPPVPEPSVWVLVLAGAGLAVCGTRRRFNGKACSVANLGNGVGD